MKLYKFFIFGLLILGLFSIFGLAFAVDKTVAVTPDTNAIPLARVNILDAKITSSNESTFNISFKLTNGEGVQSGIRYGVRLFSLNEKGQPVAVIDEKIYPEVVSLISNTEMNKEIIYDAPKILSGNYTLAIFSENESGFPFGLVSVGKIKLVASLKGVRILSETCSARLETKDPKKNTKNLVVSQGESINLTCTAVNSENEPVSVVPYFETTSGGVYGEKVEALGGDTGVITFNKLEKKVFSVVLPQPKDPQAYYTKVMLREGAQYSNSFGVAYSINGSSATIINLFFDKDYFNNGDVANLSIIWSSQIRPENDFSIGMSVFEKGGSKCGEIKQVLPKDSLNKKIEISVPIKRDCINPSILVSISDNEGKILDEKTFSVETKSIDTSKNKFNLATILIIVGVVLIIIIGLILYMKKKNKSVENSINIPPIALLFLLLACSFFIPFYSVKADTFNFPGSYAYVSINIDRSNYSPMNFIPATPIIVTTFFNLYGQDPNLFSVTINGESIPTNISSIYTREFTVTKEVPGVYPLSISLGLYNTPDDPPLPCYLAKGETICPPAPEGNWVYSDWIIFYEVAVPVPVVTVITDAIGGKVNSGSFVNVKWKVNNKSSETTCKGSISGTNLNGSVISDIDFTNGVVENLTGVPILVSGKTTFKVTCKNDYTKPLYTCSGSYQLPMSGVCNGGLGEVAGSIGVDGVTPGPYEGMMCSELNKVQCGAGWQVHGCNGGWTTIYVSQSCSGLSQSVCNLKSGCSWMPSVVY